MQGRLEGPRPQGDGKKEVGCTFSPTYKWTLENMACVVALALRACCAWRFGMFICYGQICWCKMVRVVLAIKFSKGIKGPENFSLRHPVKIRRETERGVHFLSVVLV